jgi:pyruvate,water dikinase
VLFTIDPETGSPDVVLVNAGGGLGENVVRGTVEPDQYLVFKPLLDRPELSSIIEKTRGEKQKKLFYATSTAGRGSRRARPSAHDKATRNVSMTKAECLSFVLTDAEALTIAHLGCAIEAHYGRPVDVDWAKDGEAVTLHVVQARPETVQSRQQAGVL